MNRPDPLFLRSAGDADPVFQEPWEARAFALVVAAHEKGLFTWTEWAEVLGSVIHSNAVAESSYRSWLEALEKILLQRSCLSEHEVTKRRAEWEKALIATPHGKSVELGNIDRQGDQTGSRFR